VAWAVQWERILESLYLENAIAYLKIEGVKVVDLFEREDSREGEKKVEAENDDVVDHQ
jgi:hypothetical protein